MAIVIPVIDMLLAINMANNTKNDIKPAITKETADTAKKNGIDVFKNKDYAKSKNPFENAKKQYEAIGDEHGSVDSDGLLAQLENTQKQH